MSVFEHKIIVLNKPTYKRLLKLLEKNSDRFNLVSPHTFFTKEIYNIDMTETQKYLSDYCISHKWVNKWPGTKGGKKVLMQTYKINDYCIDYLKSIDSFFALEDQMDIAFYHLDECVCYTISHEELCLVCNDIYKQLNV